jgi:LytS/YehU family sensor histidine kinase
VAIILFWEIILLVGKFLDRFLSVDQRPDLRIIAQVGVTLGISTLLGWILSLAIGEIYSTKVPESFLATVLVVDLLSTIIFNLVYFGSHFFQEWKKSIVRSERLQREQAEVRYNALRNQLNPHFLFNALTSLNSLIFENQQLASDFLKQLSKVYRYTLQNKNNETVSLRTEMEFINHYLFLLQTRFTSALQFVVDIQAADFDKAIAPVTTQMLIENAVKHNIVSESHPLQITITTKDSYLIVTNTINKKKQIETSNKQGLESLRSLYQYLSSKRVEIIETVNTFTVKIPLI